MHAAGAAGFEQGGGIIVLQVRVTDRFGEEAGAAAKDEVWGVRQFRRKSRRCGYSDFDILCGEVAGVGAAALGLAACGGSKSGSTATSGSASSAAGSSTGSVNTAGFTVQYGPNPETLDPALNSAIDASNTIITIFEPLLLINENNEVIGGQAESWEASEDGLTWTFTMRDGLKWSDGTDLTAKDFEYSFKRMANPDTAAPYAATCLGMIDGFDAAQAGDTDALNVKASDDGKTLTIVLAYPCSWQP